MKTIFALFAAMLFIGCSNQSGDSAPNELPKGKTDTETVLMNYSSVNEVELSGLSEVTRVRVARALNTVVISIMMESAEGVTYKTTTIRNIDASNKSEIDFETNTQNGLFNQVLNEKVKSRRSIDTHFAEFKKLMQAYHLKDIYRCRDSRFWSQLVNYTPDKRGPALLRLEAELFFFDVQAEAMLAIDFQSQKLIDITFRKTPYIGDQLSGDNYVGATQADKYHVFGPGSQVTQTLGLFSLFCDEEYKKLLPNYTGNGFFEDVDKRASVSTDRNLEAIIKDKDNLDMSQMGLGGEVKGVFDLPEELEQTKNFALKTQWDFYFKSIQYVRTNSTKN